MSVCTLLGSIYVDSMHYERLWEIKNGDLWQSSMDERGILLIKHEQKHLSLTDNENQPCSSSVACVELCEKRKYTAWCLAAFNFSLVPPYFLLPYFLENNLSYFTLTYTDPVPNTSTLNVSSIPALNNQGHSPARNHGASQPHSQGSGWTDCR